VEQRATRLTLEKVMINTIITPNRWSRRHSAAQISKIMASIQTFGVINPIIIDANGVLVAGEARLQAAANWLRADFGDSRRSPLADEGRGLPARDNQLAYGGTWIRIPCAIRSPTC
jgi:hypothetical protein